MKLGKYSFGVGDRFGRQGCAQLQALLQAQKKGIQITPVWNKSYREHEIIGTHPRDVRQEADAAVSELGWSQSYFVDADHVGMKTVDLFLESSDFFTLDVADFIGQPAAEVEIEAFCKQVSQYVGGITIPGIEDSFSVSASDIEVIARKYLFGVKEAGRIFRHIQVKKGAKPFIVEVSMDETDDPQTPLDLLFILAAIADEKVPVQTIAPKFSGRFNKGVDYVGDLSLFSKEFEQDIAVIAYAIREFDLPANLKLSVHSGSDKFAIYPIMRKAMEKMDAGIHLKTAGTTWLEEVIGLAEAGDAGLDIAREIYRSAVGRYDELCGPYATVIDIDQTRLSDPEDVNAWDGKRFARTLRHNQNEPEYSKDFRQLIHVGYKIAAEMGERYLKALEQYEPFISRNVTENLLDRHVRPLFL